MKKGKRKTKTVRNTKPTVTPVARKWKTLAYKDWLNGSDFTSLARKYKKTLATVKKAISDKEATFAEFYGNVERVRQQYIDRLNHIFGLAEELHASSTGNAQASALKQMALCAEKVAAASGVATQREAVEQEPIEVLIRNLIELE